MDLNESQAKAVEAIDKNVILQAGAGTGKTNVLTKRYIKILENGNLKEGREVESIVAITFTKKAAKEMTSRIRAAIRDKFKEGERWKSLYRDMDRANISTIHSFCGSIVRENAVFLGLDPRFKLMDDYESKFMFREILEREVLKGLEEDRVLFDLFINMETNSVDFLCQGLENIYYKIRTLGEDFESVEKKTIDTITRSVNKDWEDKIRENYRLLMKNSGARSKYNSIGGDRRWIEFNQGLHTSQDLEDILKLLKDKMGALKGYENIIDETVALIDQSLFIYEKENIPYYKSLFKILNRADLQYSLDKNKIASLDFDDLQILAYRVLLDEENQTYYRDKYSYIMVDEFQDSNEIQRKILYALCSKDNDLDRKNLFVVGDEKQSIYRFRGGDIGVFNRVKSDMGQIDPESIMEMRTNYRTVDKLVEFVNQVFSSLMETYYIPLDPDKKTTEIDGIHVELMDTNNNGSADESKEIEAGLICQRINSLIEEGYKYKDIAIISRTKTNDHIYEEKLLEYGIPFYNSDSGNLYLQEEIKDLIVAIMAIIDLDNDIYNISFLKSPMIGLSDLQVMDINGSEGNIYEKLHLNKDKYSDVLEIYDSLIHNYNINNPYEFINYLIEYLEYEEVLLFSKNWKNKIANLSKFKTILLADYGKGYINYEDLLGYLLELEGKQEDRVQVEGEDSNVVRLMSIHKSKGLEYKVVIVPNLIKKATSRPGLINLNLDMGIGINLKERNYMYNKIKELENMEEAMEEDRVLYVAMTRAEELLILGMEGKKGGYKKDLESLIQEGPIGYIDQLDEACISEGEEDFDFAKYRLGNLENFMVPRKESYYSNYHSISKYNSFKKCKREYYLKHKLMLDLEARQGGSQIEEENLIGLSALDKGNIVHKFIEAYDGQSDPYHFLEELLGQMAYNYESIKPDLINYIKNYLQFQEGISGHIIKEREFYFSFNGKVLNGVIDMIIVGEDIEVIDFKTNKIFNRKRLIDQYRAQLSLYIQVCKLWYPDKEVRARLIFLEDGTDYSLRDGLLVAEDLKSIGEYLDYTDKKMDLASYDKTCVNGETCVYYKICKEE